MSEPNRDELVAMLAREIHSAAERAVVPHPDCGMPWDKLADEGRDRITSDARIILSRILDRPDPAPVLTAEFAKAANIEAETPITIGTPVAAPDTSYRELQGLLNWYKPNDEPVNPPVAAPHDLAGLAAMCAKCDAEMTPGEWRRYNRDVESYTEGELVSYIVARAGVYALTNTDPPGIPEANAEGIATLRNALPQLAAALTWAAGLHTQFDGRPESFLQLLKERARELQPDYPFKDDDDAFDWLWAITSGFEGTDKANSDLHMKCTARGAELAAVRRCGGAAVRRCGGEWRNWKRRAS